MLAKLGYLLLDYFTDAWFLQGDIQVGDLIETRRRERDIEWHLSGRGSRRACEWMFIRGLLQPDRFKDVQNNQLFCKERCESGSI